MLLGGASELNRSILMVILWLKIALGMALLSLKKSKNVNQELKIDEVIKNSSFSSKKCKNDQVCNILTNYGC